MHPPSKLFIYAMASVHFGYPFIMIEMKAKGRTDINLLRNIPYIYIAESVISDGQFAKVWGMKWNL